MVILQRKACNEGLFEMAIDLGKRRVATVFGGSGFIGRYVVKRLADQGYIVRVAVRDPESAGKPW